MRRRWENWTFDDVMGILMLTLILGFGGALFLVFATRVEPEEIAQERLGKGAVCTHDEGNIYRCIYNGSRYECIVRGEAACSPLKP